MAGDGGRVSDVSERRAEIEAATRASAPEGLYYSEAKLWFEENPRQASVRAVLERLVRVRRALNAERVPSDPASVLAALLAESPEATIAAIEALLTSPEAVEAAARLLDLRANGSSRAGNKFALAHQRRRVTEAFGAACRSLLSKAPKEGA